MADALVAYRGLKGRDNAARLLAQFDAIVGELNVSIESARCHRDVVTYLNVCILQFATIRNHFACAMKFGGSSDAYKGLRIFAKRCKKMVDERLSAFSATTPSA